MKVVRWIPLALLAATTLAAAADEKPWFDLENCAFCSQMAKQPGLLENMKMEYHHTGAGLVSVGYVAPGYWDEYEKAGEGMAALVKEMQSGKIPPMCGHCQKMGEFQMRGVKMEEVKSAQCVIYLYSATDPALVQELHAFGDRCAAEIAKKPAAKKS